MKHYIFFLSIPLLLFACTSATPVQDQVTVKIGDFYEYGDEYGNIGRAVLIVENLAVIHVYSAVISIRLETTAHCYYTTIHHELGVPPESAVYITVEFAYLSPGEHALDGGIAITDSFFM